MSLLICLIWIVSLSVELPQVAGWFPFVYYHNAFGCLSPSYHHMGYNHVGFTVFSISKKVLLTLLPTPLIGYCYYKILGVSFQSKKSDVILKKRFGANGYHEPKHKIEAGQAKFVTQPLGRLLTQESRVAAIISKTSEKYHCYKKSFIWLIIVISYVICWSPVSVLGIAMNFLDAYCESIFPRGLIIAVFVIAIINSCVNPVIYGFLHHQVRKTFADILWCRSTQQRLRNEQIEEQQVLYPYSGTLSTVVSDENLHRTSTQSLAACQQQQQQQRPPPPPANQTRAFLFRSDSFARQTFVREDVYRGNHGDVRSVANSFSRARGSSTKIRNTFARSNSLNMSWKDSRRRRSLNDRKSLVSGDRKWGRANSWTNARNISFKVRNGRGQSIREPSDSVVVKGAQLCSTYHA